VPKWTHLSSSLLFQKMSQYYRPPLTRNEEYLERWQEDAEEPTQLTSYNLELNDSILIFPNPPSASAQSHPPSAGWPSSGSDPSPPITSPRNSVVGLTPTSQDISLGSMSWEDMTLPQSQSQSRSPLVPDNYALSINDTEDSWYTCMESLTTYSDDQLEEAVSQVVTNWLHSIGPVSAARKQKRLSSEPGPSTTPLSPPTLIKELSIPPSTSDAFHLPLLSFITRIFSIDRTTLDLLHQLPPPDAPLLFPSHPRDRPVESPPEKVTQWDPLLFEIIRQVKGELIKLRDGLRVASEVASSGLLSTSCSYVWNTSGHLVRITTHLASTVLSYAPSIRPRHVVQPT
jgi:hypothetical protein